MSQKPPDLARLRQTTRASLCVSCGKCTSICPMSGSGRVTARRIADRDLEEYREGLGIGRCLTCGACEERCPQGVHFKEYVRGLRERMTDDQRRPAPHDGIFLRAARLENGRDGVAERPEWLDDDAELADEGEVGLFVGCLPLFDRVFGSSLGLRTRDIARDAVRLLNHLGVRPVLVAEEHCCGHDHLWRGEREVFEELARANAAAFSARGVKHVVTACAECARTWRKDMPEVVPEYRPKVQHVVELAAEHLGKEVFARATGEEIRVSYHDPCRLSRHLDVVDEPRAVLGELQGVELIEMEHHGRSGPCCGTSGFIHCDHTSRRLQRERLSSAQRTGAEALLTACPKCLIHFSCAQAEDRRRGVATEAIWLVDWTSFVAERLRGGAAAMQRSPQTAGAERGEPR